MSFRAIDGSGDWIWGMNKSSYATKQKEIEFNIRTRVLSFLGDCFFAINEGIDYWRLLDYNGQDELENQIKAVIIATPGVQKVDNLDIITTSNRDFILSYDVFTIYSTSITETIPLNNMV